MGRYAREYAELASKQRDIRVVAEAFAKDFGGTENAEAVLDSVMALKTHCVVDVPMSMPTLTIWRLPSMG